MTSIKIFLYPEDANRMAKGETVVYFKSPCMSFQQVTSVECNVDIQDIVEITESTIQIKA